MNGALPASGTGLRLGGPDRAYREIMLPPEVPAARFAALVVNPVKADRRALERLLRAHSEAAQWDPPRIFETTIDDLGQAATGHALAEGAAVVAVAGGDGTVRAVAEALAGTNVPLAIIPSGTGNLLARNLRLPLGDPEPMVRAIFGGARHPIDMGFAQLTRADGERERHGFVVMAGAGLDAWMIANTNPDLKRRFGWVAYLDGAAKSLVKAEPFPVIYQRPGHRMHTARVHSVLVANCGALPAGISLIPDASVSDGLLDVAIFQPRAWYEWFFVWRRVWWDNSFLRRSKAGRWIIAARGNDDTVLYLQSHEFDLAINGTQPVELDGDEFGEAKHLSCELAHHGLLVVTPATR